MSVDIEKLMAFNAETKKKIKQREKREEDEFEREQALKSAKETELKKEQALKLAKAEERTRKTISALKRQESTIIELKAEIEKTSQYGDDRYVDGIDIIVNRAIKTATGKRKCREIWNEILKLSIEAAGVTDRIEKLKLDPLTGTCTDRGIQYKNKDGKITYLTIDALRERLRRRKNAFEKSKVKQSPRMRTEI